MIIDDQILNYLKGEAFSTGLVAEFSKERHVPLARETVIVNSVEGKKVVHAGCSDHIPVIREKISTNSWLHKLLTEKAVKCIGIDIDSESIEFLKNELGYTNVYCADIVKDDIPAIREDSWDYVVFGEMIEHLGNPVSFLSEFRIRYGMNVKNFIVSVPNILNINRYRNMLNYREVINSDHMFWFTPYTISRILVSAGYRPEKILYAGLCKLNSFELIVRKIKQISGIRQGYPFYYFNTI
ncbi:MAG: methyltransferase domain-containing protein, partial [Bacteroidales bacterium]|nr:methyltransferase domain-containing protein [Bacteroidales bacterium]